MKKALAIDKDLIYHLLHPVCHTSVEASGAPALEKPNKIPNRLAPAPPNIMWQHNSLGGYTLKFRQGMGVPERPEWIKMRARLF